MAKRRKYGFAEGFQQTFAPTLDENLRAELRFLAEKPQRDLALKLGEAQLGAAQTSGELGKLNLARGGEDFLTPEESKAYETSYGLTPGALMGVRRQVVGDLLERSYTDPATGKVFKLGPGGKLAPATSGAASTRTREQDFERMRDLEKQIQNPKGFEVMLGQQLTEDQMKAERQRAQSELDQLYKQYRKPRGATQKVSVAPATQTPGGYKIGDVSASGKFKLTATGWVPIK